MFVTEVFASYVQHNFCKTRAEVAKRLRAARNAGKDIAKTDDGYEISPGLSAFR